MTTFKEFLEKSKSALCKEYTEKLNKAGSKKAMLDLALDANGLSWTAEAIVKGELRPEVIHKEFAPFINGKYIREIDGYKSTLWCYPDNVEIKIDSTSALIICHDGEIVVNRPLCELYLVNSDCVIKGRGVARIFLYNSSVSGNNFEIVKNNTDY